MANLKDIIVNGTSRFIGKVFGPTPSEGDYSKQLATTEYVIDNSANQSISNLTEEGESKINASKCLLTNAIVTDPTAYNAVKNYSQDSFDLSKFTVVGSPTITDDGVASGFSSSNYIQKLSILPTEVGHNYIFKTRYKHITNNFSETGYMFDIVTTTGDFFGVMARMRTKTISFVNTIKGTSIISDFTALVEGKTYDIEYHTDFSTYVKYYVDGDLKQSLTYSATGYPITGNVLIGVSSNAELPLTMGSIDLKHFSITVDGKEVFSGNKTGLDAIKPLDAEELGDIYVNEHGIAENFNVNNAIKAPISFNPISTVKIRSLLTWNTGSTQPKDGINVPYVFGPNKWRLEVTSTNIHATNDLDTSTNTAFNIAIPELQNGNVIEIIETITIGTRTVKVIINETDEYSGSTTFAATQAFSTSELAIGNAAFDGSSEYFWNGAINLNMFIVYIDGKLAYEPCLYIPYTQSKTGSKIVENVYRNRVYELYTQTGKAEYYTLDTENENITLPLGEIYGLITSKADTVNVANKSLEDLTDDGNALINNSKAWITGKLTNDKTTYDAIKKLSVSTFDRSKFTVVGSPTITDDGVASGFSGSNYIKLPISLSEANSWEITLKNKSLYSKGYLLGGNILNTIAYIKGSFYISSNGTSWDVASNVGTVTDIPANSLIQLEFTGSKYISKYSTDNGLNWNITGELNSNVKITDKLDTLYVGVIVGGISANCSIDLKHFSIIVDGVEVFSGNRTELDVIKADNFEVVGSPDISDDGIVSGFSSNNELNSGIANKFVAKNKIELVTHVNFSNIPVTNFSGIAGLWSSNTNYILSLGYSASNNFYLGTTGTLGSAITNLTTLTLNSDYIFTYGIDLANNYFYVSSIKKDGVELLTQIKTSSLTKTDVDTAQWVAIIGIVPTQPGNYLSNGSIDLNSFKIYVDGNLVYQPCLKIPYTLSKTGSKIVDAAYYDRVIDVYEQYGSAYYYTLDRQNNLSSLPFGDIYGLMMKKDDSPDYFSADIPAEFPFIAWREGYINVTVPANEKLLINDNEVVSAGTSAVQMQLRVGLYDNITFSNTAGATLTFYPCKGVLYTI